MLIVFVDLLMQLVMNIEKTLLNAPRVDRERQNRLLNQYYRDTYNEHSEIAEAIINHDPEKARAAMLRHRQNWADIFRQLCRKDSGDPQT
jgi:DNA-binding FadR family transcriptional regulator